MGWASDILFRLGYKPLIHESVKTDFIDWYYRASKSERVVRELDLSNPELKELAIQAQQTAESFDENHQIPQFISAIEDFNGRIQWAVDSATITAMFVAGSATILIDFSLREYIVKYILQVTSILTFVSAAALFAVFRLLKWHIKTNTDLIVQFNQALSEKPGEVVTEEQDWHQLVSKYIWNRSLLDTNTHIALIVLSVIKAIRPSYYGKITADIDANIQRWMEKSEWEIIKEQASRIGREFSYWRESE